MDIALVQIEQPRNFEVLDSIYDKMRKKTNDSIAAVEPLIRKQAKSLYYNKKINLTNLEWEKKELDDQNVERLILKTQIYMSQAQF